MIQPRWRLLGATAALGATLPWAGKRAQAQQPREIEGFRFDANARVAGSELVLKGVGVRKRFFVPVYVAGLYVPQRSSDPEVLLRQRGPRRMAMRFVREVEAELFMTSLSEGMRRNYAASQLTAWRPQLDTLTTVISTMVLARRADNITWDYTEEGGRIMQNSVPRLPSIPGEDFYNAVLRVWLGDQPADAELKRGLLGA